MRSLSPVTAHDDGKTDAQRRFEEVQRKRVSLGLVGRRKGADVGRDRSYWRRRQRVRPRLTRSA